MGSIVLRQDSRIVLSGNPVDLILQDADIGIAGGKSDGLFFKDGKPVKKVPAHKWIDEIIKELQRNTTS